MRFIYITRNFYKSNDKIALLTSSLCYTKNIVAQVAPVKIVVLMY